MTLSHTLALKVKNELGVLPCLSCLLMITPLTLPSRGPDRIIIIEEDELRASSLKPAVMPQYGPVELSFSLARCTY